jgi:hypothetical protein
MGTPRRIAGPAYILASATNIYTPPASTIYTIIRHIHVANRTNAAATFSLFIGATGGSAAGTELAGTVSVAANSVWDWYGYLRMDSADFLSGIASGATSLAIIVEGEQNVV